MTTPFATSWSEVGDLRGPKGDTGSTGPPGPSGNTAPTVRTVTYASSRTVTALDGVGVDRVAIAATGNLTLTPAGGVDGQVLRVNVAGSGGTRTITVASAVALTTALSRTITVPSGQVALLAFEYVGALSGWALTAAAVTGG